MKELLRIATAGSVDDGKSTMIGRLLFDTKQILNDQIESIKKASERKGLDKIDLSLIVDGLKAEREQGITIDVAHRYFSTSKRKFVIYDSPGHFQYTRNAVTGMSNADLAIILIDARNGITEQTKRHSFIASLLQIPHIVVCINKMDLVNYDEKVFNNIKEEYEDFASKLDIKDLHFIPICALEGDNISIKSNKMSWYEGQTLIYLLENIYMESDNNLRDCRFPVQYVIRPNNSEFHDHRSYAGRISSGIFKPGDKIITLPSGFTSKIKSIDFSDKKISEAFPPMSVTIQLEDDLDIQRGDMITRADNPPIISQDLDVMICWLNPRKLSPDRKYIIKHTTKEAKCVIKEIVYKININTLHRILDDKEINMNDLARIKIRTTSPLFYDPYSKNKTTGSLILIDESTNETVAVGMIR